MGAGASSHVSLHDFVALRNLYEAKQLRDADEEVALKTLRRYAVDELEERHQQPKDEYKEAKEDRQSIPPAAAPITITLTTTKPRFHLDDEHVTDHHELCIGDVVRVRDGGMTFEGVISSMCKLEEHAVVVDFGDSEEKVDIRNCELMLRSIDFEVDDVVEVQPAGFLLFFRGRILKNNHNGTFDVKIDSDDPNDVELDVPFENIRKLMTNRSMASMRLHKAANAIKTMNAFKSMGHFHAKAAEKLHSIKARHLEDDKEDAD